MKTNIKALLIAAGCLIFICGIAFFGSLLLNPDLLPVIEKKPINPIASSINSLGFCVIVAAVIRAIFNK